MTDQKAYEELSCDECNDRFEALQAAYTSKQKEINQLQELLSDAADSVEEWGAYVSPYFQEKWDLVGDIARIRAAVGKTTIEEKPPVEPEEVYSPNTVIVDDKCRKCAGQMRDGKAIAQTAVGTPDFAGGAVVTMSPGGSGKMIDCRKCSECGWSVGK